MMTFIDKEYASVSNKPLNGNNLGINQRELSRIVLTSGLTLENVQTNLQTVYSVSVNLKEAAYNFSFPTTSNIFHLTNIIPVLGG